MVWDIDILTGLSFPEIDYKQAMAKPPARDIGNKEIQGILKTRTIRTALFTRNSCAVWAADFALRNTCYPYMNILLVCNRHVFVYEIGDVFKFSYEPEDIFEMVVRVLRIEEADLIKESIKIYIREEPTNLANLMTEYPTPIDHATPKPSYRLSPIVYGKVIEAPYKLAGSEAIKLIPLAAKEHDLSLGYYLYMSLDEGVSYNKVGVCTRYTPYGTLLYAYSADTNRIDDGDDGITITFTRSDTDEFIETISRTSLLGLTNLALLGDELITFQTITPDPVVSNRFKLTGIVRGRFDTEAEDHAIGTEFWYLGTNFQTFVHQDYHPGIDVTFKMLPFNYKTIHDISVAYEYDLSIVGRVFTPYIPLNLRADGEGVRPYYTGDIVLDWDCRTRTGYGAGVGIASVVTDASPVHEGYFEIEVYVNDVLVRTATAIDALTYTYTTAMNNTDNGSLADEIVFKLSNYRTAGGVTYESDQVELTVEKES
jgi:hypothetical protein